MKYTLRLLGSIETLSPFCIVPPNAEEITKANKQKYKRIANMVIYNDGLRENRPVIPGATLRGRIRRSAVDAVLALSGEKISLSTWHQNAVGGIKGAESESGYDIVMRDEIRRKNPILSLFGAGSPWIGSRVQVEQAIPNHSVETDIVGGVRADDGRRDNEFFQKLTDGSADEWLSLVDANSVRSGHKQSVKQLESDLRKARKEKNDAEVARLDAELKLKRQDEDGAKALASNPVSMPLAHEAMPMGVVLDHAITLTGVTKEEIGLFFAALNHFWAKKPAIGQHENLGYGLATYTYELALQREGTFNPFKIGSEHTEFETLGTVLGGPYSGIQQAPSFVEEAMDAFTAAFASGAYDFNAIAQTASANKGEE